MLTVGGRFKEHARRSSIFEKGQQMLHENESSDEKLILEGGYLFVTHDNKESFWRKRKYNRSVLLRNENWQKCWKKQVFLSAYFYLFDVMFLIQKW